MSTANKILSALRNVKQTGLNKYRANSPLRADSDGQNFALEIIDDEHGTWFDHKEEKGGSLYELASLMNIPTPTGKQVADTKRAYTGLADYAKAHGIPPETLMRAGWSEEKKNGRAALKFVTRTGNRWRFIDGQKPNYISQNGYQKCWYGFNETLLSQLSYGADLVIANGEVSTVVGQAYGLATVSITAGEGAIPAELLTELKERMKPHSNTKIVVALDCDDKGRKASDTMVKQLKAQGFNAVAVDLGLSKGGDLADFLTLYGIENDDKALSDFKKLPLIDVFEYTPTKRWTIMHARELANLPMVKWLVKNEIPDKALTVIYGASGVGKSFVTLDYALRVAQTGNVVYIAGEGETGYHGRIRAWCQYHGRNEGGLYMCLGAVSLLDDGDLETFIYEVTRIVKHPQLIVVDTLARSMLGGDENSSRDMAIFIDRCDMIKQRFGCAVIVVHHTNKTGIWERGSGALRGATEMMLRISDEDDLIVIECSKSKNDKGFEPIYRRLQPVDVGLVNEDGDKVMPAVAVLTERSYQEDLNGLTSNQRKVLTEVAKVFDNGFTIAELNEVLPAIDRGSMYRIISRLKKLGYITQPSKREPYEITHEGLKIANVANVANVAVVHEKTEDENTGDEKTKYNRNNRDNRDNRKKDIFGSSSKSYYDEGL